MKAIARAQVKIRQAIKKLEESADKGRVARRNARSKLFGAIKTLELAVDKDFPLEPKLRPVLDSSLEGKAKRFKYGRFVGEIRSQIDIGEIPTVDEIQAFHCAFADKFQKPQRAVIGGKKYWGIDDNYLYVPTGSTWYGILVALEKTITSSRSRDRGMNRALLSLYRLWEQGEWQLAMQETRPNEKDSAVPA